MASEKELVVQHHHVCVLRRGHGVGSVGIHKTLIYVHQRVVQGCDLRIIGGGLLLLLLLVGILIRALSGPPLAGRPDSVVEDVLA